MSNNNNKIRKNNNMHLIVKAANVLDVIKLTLAWLLELISIVISIIFTVRSGVMLYTGEHLEAALSIAAAMGFITLCVVVKTYLSEKRETGGG